MHPDNGQHLAACPLLFVSKSYFEISNLICQVWDFKMRCHCVKVMSRKDRRQEGDSPLEELRLARTELTQDEFCVRIGIPRATYHRWIKGQTEAKPTIRQLKALAEILKIERINELPDDFGPRVRSHSQEEVE
jgi:DNA-binding XRE family transcriptional regulator